MFDQDKANRAINFFEGVLTHTKGEYAGQRFELQEWQETIIADLFGTVNEDGTRQYRTAYIEVPKKNGKSPIAAGIALYLLGFDEEVGAEIYSAAGDREQAGIVYSYAADMVRNSKYLQAMFRIIESRKRIMFEKTRSFYSAVSADVPTKHGPNIHGLIFDELHTQPNRNLWDTLATGTAARRQPLTLAITTAGFDRNSICWEQHEYAENVLDGTYDDPTFYARIYKADDDDDWLDESIWHQANPALGTFRRIEHMRAEAEKASRVPAYQNTFKRLFLNIWTQQETRWMDIRDWDATAGVVDRDELRGLRCAAGLDMSSSIDITALVLVFKILSDFIIVPYFWIPEDNIKERVEKDRVPYDVWVREGIVEATPGNVIDERHVVQRIEQIIDEDEFLIQEVAYDRFGASLIAKDIADLGIKVIPFGQGFVSMSPPTKELMNLTLMKRLHHGGNPALRWMANNMVVRQDAAGNLKPDKEKSREKIDGMVALIQGLDRATRDEYKPSVYEKRGIRSYG